MIASEEHIPDHHRGHHRLFRSSGQRLLIIPLIIYVVWVLETFLLEGSLGLFGHYQSLPLILYTVFANIMVGILVPLSCLGSAFRNGAVTTLQIGFRSLRRTALASTFTGIIGYVALVTFTPYGADRLALFNMLGLVLPVAIASVMVCWVLTGTHLQAYVRHSGAFASIVAGVLITGLLFGLTALAHSPPVNQSYGILVFILTGMASAVYFFSIRDVYASSVFVAFGLAGILPSQIDPVYRDQAIPLVYGMALLSIICLIACHLYLARNFKTVRLPA